MTGLTGSFSNSPRWDLALRMWRLTPMQMAIIGKR